MRRTQLPAILGLAMAAVSTSAGDAFGQERNAPSADVLFDRGLKELEANNLDAACPLFVESFKLDPRPGVTFTLAECEAKRGKVASASAYYEEYLRLFNQLPRAQQAKQYGRDRISKKRIAELAPKLPQLTIEVPDAVPRDVEIKRDGKPVGTPTWNVALPVDPGEHVVASRLPGGEWGEQRVTLGEAEKQTLTVAPPAVVAKAVVVATPSSDVVQTPVVVDLRRDRRPFVVATAVVGGAGLATGLVFGGLALSSRNTARDHCDGPACDAEGKRAGDRAKTFATVSTVATVIGLAGVGASLTIYFTGRGSSRTVGTPTRSPVTASLRLGAPALAP